VFTGASLQGQWFPSKEELKRDFSGWQYDYSLTGWSNGDIALKWLQQICLPETKPTNPSKWTLLILDEHSSHIKLGSCIWFGLTAFNYFTCRLIHPMRLNFSIGVCFLAPEELFQAKYQIHGSLHGVSSHQ
jgi:hypothetical protein